MLKSGAKFGTEVVVTENPATWTSRYGSVVVANRNVLVFDGMNEKGLAAHALALNTDYGARDVSKPGIQMGLLVPYILDNAATVAEARALMGRIQPVAVLVDNFAMGVSLTIEDRLGNSLVIEYPAGLKGAAKIFENRDQRVMANTDIDVANEYLNKNFPFNVDTATRSTLIPGNGAWLDRYVRASFFSAFLSKTTPRSLLEEKAALMSVMRNVSNPIGAPGDASRQDQGLGDETDWRTISDLTNRVYMFDSPRTLNTVSTDLSRLDFRRGTGVRIIDPVNPHLQGDITRRYRPTSIRVPGVVVRAG